MRRIREKLNSQSGASILMALLFFLVCAMVGASVLMASASNAGKSRSNRQEQQKYLTLSSAMQLVCKELTDAKYTARYNYVATPHYVDVKNSKGEVIGQTLEYTTHRYTQTRGVCGGELLHEAAGNVLPLLDELDWLFAQDFSGCSSSNPKDVFEYVERSGLVHAGGTHTLTLTVTGQPDKPGLTTPVTVTVTLGKDGTEKYRLFLTAVLESDPFYMMYAQLDIKGGPAAMPKPANPPLSEDNLHSCTPVEWELTQITREEPK